MAKTVRAGHELGTAPKRTWIDVIGHPIYDAQKQEHIINTSPLCADYLPFIRAACRFRMTGRSDVLLAAGPESAVLWI